MKRPVFWAVVVFALGEVSGQMIQTEGQRSIAVVMLLCVVLFWEYAVRSLYKNARGLKKRWFVPVLLFGAAHNLIFTYDCRWNENMRQWETDFAAAGKIETVTGTSYGSYRAVVAVKGCKRKLLVTLPPVYSADTEVVTEGGGVKPWREIRQSMIPEVGDIIYFAGRVRAVAPPENPGEFNQRQYYLARKVVYEMKSPDCVYLMERPRLDFKRSVMRMRNYLKDRLFDMTDEDIACLYAGILLGDRQKIPDEIKNLLQLVGIAHILSISALHISLVAMSLYRFLRWCGMRIPCAALVSGGLIVWYGSLTGWSFSAVRAAIMLALVLIGEWTGRKTDVLTSAAVAFFVMIFAEPYRMYDGGVQIGFGAVIGIAVAGGIGRMIKKQPDYIKFEKKHGRICRLLFALLTSISVSVVTAPILAWIYFSVSIYSPFLNLMVVPLMTPVVLLGLTGLFVSFVFPPFGGLLLKAGGSLLRLFIAVSRVCVRLPFCTLSTGKPNIAEIILYYLILLGAFFLASRPFGRRVRQMLYARFHVWFTKKVWCRLLCLLLTVYTAIGGYGLVFLHKQLRGEQLVILSVGQGDGIFIRTSTGFNFAVDGGSTTRERLGSYVLTPALKSMSMQRIDYWFVSHADVDHISGLLDILQEKQSDVTIGTIVVAADAPQDDAMKKLLDAAREKNVAVRFMQEGDCIGQDGVFQIRCLQPKRQPEINAVYADTDAAYAETDAAHENTADRNSASLCLVYESNAFYVLLTGDAGAEEMTEVLAAERKRQEAENDFSPQTKIIKVPHHGSRYSCAEGIYEDFDVAVISCGKKNRYGHPHKEVLEQLEASGCEVYRTDEVGAVIVKKRGGEAVAEPYIR